MQLGMRTARSHLEDMDPRTGIIWMRAFARRPHVEHAREQRVGRTQRWNTDHDWSEASDLILRWDRTTIPGSWRVTRTAIVDEREPLALWVFEPHHLST